MNIFVLDKDPILAAQLQCDKHVVKMILESAQLLSGVHRKLLGDRITPTADAALYKQTHINHPCSIWARACAENYNWLVDHFFALLEEYTYRYGRVHASSRLCSNLDCPPNGIPSIQGGTDFALCMPDHYKRDCPVESYQNYYASKRNDFKMVWTKRATPNWMQLKETTNV